MPRLPLCSPSSMQSFALVNIKKSINMMMISDINNPGFIYQSKEFSGAGLSPEIFLSYNDWIGSEELRFFVYHMKRTAGSMVIHSLLPAGKFCIF